jgi:Na+/phosphate symporter
MDEKAYAGAIGEVLESLGKMMNDAQKFFFSRDKRALKETEKTFARHLKSSLPLFEETAAKKEKTERDEGFIALLPALQRIGMGAGDLLRGIRTTLEAEISFTDKALGEIGEIMALVKDLARDANDVLVTRNARFREYALASARHILDRVDKCGLEHQQRLVVGICSPKPSFVYLDVMHSLKRLAADLAALMESA